MFVSTRMPKNDPGSLATEDKPPTVQWTALSGFGPMVEWNVQP